MRRAFTLIELLVVMAIIAILAGLLMPALNRARQMGHQTACVSNEKNVGLMITMFENDERHFPSWNLPDAGVIYYDSSLSLATLYQNYGDTVDIFTCPATDDEVNMSNVDESGIAVNLDNDATTNDLRFIAYPPAYADLGAGGPNDPSYVIDPAVPTNPFSGRAIYADGPDMSLLRANWAAFYASPPANFPAQQYANHRRGAVVLFADDSVQFERMRGDGTLLNPRLQATDMTGFATPADAVAHLNVTDIYADDYLALDGASNPIYGGDRRYDAHLGTWVDDGNGAVQDSPNGWVGPNDSTAPYPSAGGGYGINDVYVP